MKKTLSVLFLGLVSVVLSVPASAKEGAVRVGLTAGHVGLMGDVASRHGNSLGLGLLLGYGASDEMVFEVGYLNSQHTDLKHNELTLGVNYYLSSYDAAYPFLSGGVNFVSHRIADTPTELNSNAMGLYAGGGVDFMLNEQFLVGLGMRYNKIFETNIRRGNGGEIKGVQDHINVMVRAAYEFDTKQD